MTDKCPPKPSTPFLRNKNDGQVSAKTEHKKQNFQIEGDQRIRDRWFCDCSVLQLPKELVRIVSPMVERIDG